MSGYLFLAVVVMVGISVDDLWRKVDRLRGRRWVNFVRGVVDTHATNINFSPSLTRKIVSVFRSPEEGALTCFDPEARKLFRRIVRGRVYNSDNALRGMCSASRFALEGGELGKGFGLKGRDMLLFWLGEDTFPLDRHVLRALGVRGLREVRRIQSSGSKYSVWKELVGGSEAGFKRWCCAVGLSKCAPYVDSHVRVEEELGDRKG